MIDRITPNPSPETESALESQGWEDLGLIKTAGPTFAGFANTEACHYLVIEDSFPNGRPALDEGGVILCDRETAERAEKNARALADRLEKEEAAQVASFKEAMEQITSRVKSLAAERERIVASLPATLVASYEAARKRFGGVAVETLEGNRPSACRVALQPSSFTDIRRSGADVTTCPYCKRILVVATEEA